MTGSDRRPSRRNVSSVLCSVLFGLSFGLLGSPAGAHPPIEDALRRLAPEALTGTAAARAYLERGELERLEREWDLALADYTRAEALAPSLPGLDLARAELLLDRGQPATCEAAADGIVARDANALRAIELRARARAAQGMLGEAARDYDRWIHAAARVTPDDFIRRARWLEAAGPAYLDEALRGIDAGITRFGPIAGLLIEASEIESRLGHFAESRARLDRLDEEIARVRRHEPAPQRVPQRASTAAPRAPVTTAARAAGSSDPPTQPVLTRGPYLQAGGSSRIVIRWRTDVPCDSRVELALDDNPSIPVLVPGDVTDHEVELTDLGPAMEYKYSIGTTCCDVTGITFASSSFVTAPAPGPMGPTRVWLLGDSGFPTPDLARVRDAFLHWNGVHRLDAFLMLGDNAYNNGTDSDYQAAVFNMFPTLLAQHVLWPTRGNHDLLYAPLFSDYYDIFSMPTAGECGGMPSASEAYYSFDIGHVHFVCLDSEGSDRTRSGPMLRWLESDLAASSQPWNIAFWHHPPYSKGSHDSDNPIDSDGRMRDMRQVAGGILDSAGVDLMISGHSHSYERSYLLRGHYGVSATLTSAMKVDSLAGRIGGTGPYHKFGEGRTPLDGIVYTVLGSSSSVHFGTMNHPVMISSLLSLGSIVLDIEGLRLDARFLNDQGVALDSFAIFKGAALAAPRDARVADLAPRLRSIAPNPMRAASSIVYVMPRAGDARISVVDPAGRRVRLLESGRRAAGAHTIAWDGRRDSGHRVTPGVYFALLESGAGRSSARFAVLE